MGHEREFENALEYAMNKFHGLGVAVSIEGLRTAVEYVGEYFEDKQHILDEVIEEHQNEGDDEGEGVAGFVVFTEEDVIDYITKTRPNIPYTAVKTILEARQEYIETLHVYDADELEDMEVEGDEEKE